MKKKLIVVFIIILIAVSATACADVGVKFIINFESNGGTACSPIETNGSNSVKMPKNPTKENYEFDGWFWDDGVWQEPFTFNSILDKPISDTMTLTVYAKWKIINKNKMAIPTLIENSFVYDGTAKTVSLSLSNNAAYALSGDITKTNAGNYSVQLRLNDPSENEWTDGTTNNLSLDWSIAKRKVDKPALSQSNFSYDGIAKTVTLNAQNNAAYTLSGSTSSTNAGNYVASVSLTNAANYEWTDGTTDALSFTWSIEKGVPATTVPQNVTATFGQTLSSVALPTGWAWVQPTALVGDTGQRTHAAVYTPSDTNNYTTISQTITVNVTHSVLNIRADGFILRWDSISATHRIYFEIDGIFVYHSTATSVNTFNILNIPEDATAMGIDQLNTQGVPQERAVIYLRDAATTVVSFNSINSTNTLSWNSSASSHRVSFLDGDKWIYYGEYGRNFSVLDIPTYASEMRIIPIAWSYNSATKTLIKPLSYDIPIATVSSAGLNMVSNIRMSDNRLMWDQNAYYSNFRIYSLVDGVWQFDGTVTTNGYTGNSIALLSYDSSSNISVNFSENVEAIRIAPVGWNSSIFDLVNSTSETWHIVRVAPTVVSVSKSSKEMVTNLRITRNSLQWDSPSTYHNLYVKIEGVWQRAGTMSSGATGGSWSLYDDFSTCEAFRIDPMATLFSFDGDTNTLQIFSSLPTEINIAQSPQGMRPITNVRIENSDLTWDSAHGGQAMLYFKINGEWVEYGYNGYGYLWNSNIPKGATAVRLVPINGAAYSFDQTTNTVIRHLEMLTTEVTFEESNAAIEAFTNIRRLGTELRWDGMQNGPRSIYFKVDGEWVLYSNSQWMNSIALSSIPQKATAMKVVLNNDIYSYDTTADKILYHTNVLPIEISLPFSI